MKKTLNLTVWLIIACTFYWACKKDQTTSNKNLTTEEQELITNAKTYFETNVQNTIQGKRLSDVTDTTPGQFNPVKLLLKSADWDNAYTLKLSISKIVVVPIQFGDSLYARPESTDSTTRLSINNLSKLIVYKDSAKQLHVEVVTAFPDSNFINNPASTFSGVAYVQDWQGNFLRAFNYSNGQINKLTISDATQNTDVVTDAVAKPNLLAPPSVTCSATFWYNCNGTKDDPRSGGCVYTRTTNTGCVANDIDDDPAGVNYGLVAGSSGGGGGVSPTPTPNQISPIIALSGPNPITNILDYLKCFTNTGVAFQVSLNVEQPVPGARDLNGGSGSSGSGTSGSGSSNGGHTFLVISETLPDYTTVTRNIGFYPLNTLSAYAGTAGQLNNDQNGNFNVGLTITMNNQQLIQLISFIEKPVPGYNLQSNNCTTWALTALSTSGIDINTTKANRPGLFSGDDPGDLGEDIRGMQLSSSMTRTTYVGQNSPSNTGTCTINN